MSGNLGSAMRCWAIFGFLGVLIPACATVDISWKNCERQPSIPELQAYRCERYVNQECTVDLLVYENGQLSRIVPLNTPCP
jgi:hypothetical protein